MDELNEWMQWTNEICCWNVRWWQQKSSTEREWRRLWKNTSRQQPNPNIQPCNSTTWSAPIAVWSSWWIYHNYWMRMQADIFDILDDILLSSRRQSGRFTWWQCPSVRLFVCLSVCHLKRVLLLSAMGGRVGIPDVSCACEKLSLGKFTLTEGA